VPGEHPLEPEVEQTRSFELVAIVKSPEEVAGEKEMLAVQEGSASSRVPRHRKSSGDHRTSSRSERKSWALVAPIAVDARVVDEKSSRLVLEELPFESRHAPK
jgi:hypothetical protein